MAQEAFRLAAPTLRSYEDSAQRKTDHGIEDILEALGFKLERASARVRKKVSRLAAAMAQLIDAWSVQQQEPQFEALEIPFPRRGSRISDTLDGFRQSNVDLIQNMTEEMRGRINQVVDESLRKATRVEDLAKDLGRITRVGKARARLIGRDQTLKLYGNLTQVRHTEAGIQSYIWRTAMDERVRDGHRALNGTKHSWKVPPFTGSGLNHPGQDYQCRCVAIPVIEGVTG